MGPKIGSKVKEEALMEVLRGMEDKNAAQDKRDYSLQSASSCQDKIHDMEALSERTIMLDGSQDMELDVIGCTDNCDGGPNSECNVSTENSSSFGDTVSGTDYGLLLDDEEVESQLYGGNESQPMSNGYREVFPRRKKKLTVHWRKFISPLMWRCRWLELQITKLQSQALKYDRELALYDQRKQSVCEHFSMEGLDVKSIGFSSHAQRHRVMERKRRKKTEETTEIASYMAHHNLFSYFEKKRSLADDMSLEDTFLKLDKTRNMRHDDISDFGTIATEGWASSMLGDNDNILEDIFLKIEAAQSKVHKLKNRIDKVVNENPMKFSSINQLNFLAFSDDPSSPEDGNDVLVRSLHEASQHISEHAFGDLLMPESAIKSHGEVILLPDMIQSADCESTQKVLTQNCGVKEELQFSGEVKGQFIEQPQKLEDQKIISPAAISQADFTSKDNEPNIEPKAKPLSAVKPNSSKKTRKRGRRKTGSSKRNRKATG